MTEFTNTLRALNHVKIIFLFSCIMAISSCSVKKYIPEGQKLYGGAEIEYINTNDSINIGDTEEVLNSLLTPEPNSSILGSKIGLYYHYKSQKEKTSFITKWLNKTFGEKPVYYSDEQKDKIIELISNRLENRGFFDSNVIAKVDSTRLNASVTYTTDLGTPYTIENLKLEKDSLNIYAVIDTLLTETLIKPGNRLDLESMKAERTRIDAALKEKGYYNFNSDFLIFEADTNRYKTKKVDLFLRIKKNVPKAAVVPYTIDSITVYTNYSLSSDSLPIKPETVDGVDFINANDFFKIKKLEPYVLFKEGQYYSSEKAGLTSRRLSAIGSYKYVNIRFNEKDSIRPDDESGSLYSDIYLSPLQKRSLRTEVQAVTKSNGFAGPGISLTYLNRNLFRGGETISISGNFSYESQLLGGNDQNLSSIAGGLKTELIIPSLVPFSPKKFAIAVPKTKISLGIDFLNRSDLYTLNSFNTSFGYIWNENKYVYHEFNPIRVDFVKLSKTTAEFEDLLAQNPYLSRSFEQQFIAGLNYSFTYNELVDPSRANALYFNTQIDIAGNLLNLLTGDKTKIFNTEFAQYAKFDVELREYLRLGKQQTLVGRFFGGIGIPYGNSNSMPYVKQYFSGGPYSIRAFNIRSLGPGSFKAETTENTTYFDQSGTLKLEANLEYRFPVWSYLKGAIFIDAGNVWVTGSNPSATEKDQEDDERYALGTFDSNWYKDVAVGVGLGLRLDIQSFVIRFDLASPWRVPYLPEGQRTKTPFFEHDSDNLRLNFAIGYPF